MNDWAAIKELGIAPEWFLGSLINDSDFNMGAKSYLPDTCTTSNVVHKPLHGHDRIAEAIGCSGFLMVASASMIPDEEVRAHVCSSARARSCACVIVLDRA